MKTEISTLFKEKRPAFALLALIFLLPIVFCLFAQNIIPKERWYFLPICLIIFLTFCYLSMFFKKKKEKIALSILFALSFIPNLTVLGYLFISRLYMKRDLYWVIFETNPDESKEYIMSFATWPIVISIIAYLSAGIWLISKLHSQKSLSPKKQKTGISISVVIIVLYIVFHYLIKSVPTFDFYKSAFQYVYTNYKFEKERNERKSIKIDVNCVLPDSVQNLFVVLIGESASTCHQSLYGYHRPTTPLMDSTRAELDIFTDIVTSDTHTAGSLQKALTFASHEHPEYYTSRPDIVELFNAAGFETYWITNQGILDRWRGSYAIFAREADHLVNVGVAQQPDGIVLPALNEALTDTVNRNKIIFIHLMGNHHYYHSRYTPEFQRFDHKALNDLNKDYYTPHSRKATDDYDNSILYGDYIFNSVREQLKATEKSACLLFFSDHGEEVYDFRDASGHLLTNIYFCQARVPFVLWRSDEYKMQMPEIVIDTARSYSTEDLIYSISTLCGLHYSDYEPRKSLFTKEYSSPQKRIIGKEDYLDILKKNMPF